MCSSEAVSATIECDMCVSPEDEEEVETREVRRVGMHYAAAIGKRPAVSDFSSSEVNVK